MASEIQTESETVAGDETLDRPVSNAGLAGLAGGLVFGVLLQAMGAMPAIAALYGSESVAAGWALATAWSSGPSPRSS